MENNNEVQDVNQETKTQDGVEMPISRKLK